MKKVSIVNLISEREWGAIFGSDDEMNAWIARMELKALEGRGCGNGPRKLKKMPVGEESYLLELVVSEEDVDGDTFVNLKKEYEITITDVTAEFQAREQEKLDKASAKTRLKSIDWSEMTTVAKLKGVLKDIHRAMNL